MEQGHIDLCPRPSLTSFVTLGKLPNIITPQSLLIFKIGRNKSTSLLCLKTLTVGGLKTLTVGGRTWAKWCGQQGPFLSLAPSLVCFLAAMG